MSVVLLVIWPRFSVGQPSVIDDWSAYTGSGKALNGLLNLSYDPEAVADPRRYRPAYIAIWNWLQWHTLGAPGSMIGPNAWNLLRISAFGLSAFLVPLVVLRDSLRTSIDRLAVVSLAALLLVAIVATPFVAGDFYRFGPVELSLVWGMTLGALLLLSGMRMLLGGAWRDRRGRVIAVLAGGYAAWLFGVYSKEASVCFLVLLPFLYLHLNGRWREQGVIRSALVKQRAAQVVFAAMTVPVLHMLVEVKRIADSGTSVYGGAIAQSTNGLFAQLRGALDAQLSAMDTTLGTSFWHRLLWFAPPLLLLYVLKTRRVPWLAIGLLLLAVTALAFQGLAGIAQSRYYVPTLVFGGVAMIILAARMWPGVMALGVVALALASINNVSAARHFVDQGAFHDRDAARGVSALAKLDPWRCPTYMAGMDQEPADAFSELVQLRPRPRAGDCDGGASYLLSRSRPELVIVVTNPRVFNVCAGGWTRLLTTNGWVLWKCHKFRRGDIRGQPVQQVLREGRLIPGVRWTDRNKTPATAAK
ncbi:MAG: hypothetical protein WAP37_08045 [Solirubrobacterales bacterium]